MNDDELWSAIDTQRRRTADLLDELAAEDWDRPSLCEGWTVRDVAAHLTLQQMTFGAVLGMLLRHPHVLGDVNHVIRESSRIQARRPREQLVAGIRGTVGSRRPNVSVTPLETLIDIVVHGQDIAIPLGRTLDVPPDVAALAATRVWSYAADRKNRKKSKVFRSLPFHGHRLVATDADWSAGEGPELRGPALALLLLLTGRPAGLRWVTGEGVAAVTRSLDRTGAG